MSDVINDIKKKELGHLSSLNINLTNSDGVKINIEDIRQICVFIGANGTGKTFTLVTTYCMGYLAAILASPFSSFSLAPLSNSIFSKCFDNMNFTGDITASWSNGPQIVVKFNEGSVIEVNHSGFENVAPYPIPKYLSSNMRLFTSLKAYLSIRKYVSKEAGLNTGLIASKMTDTYKLYDVTQMEYMISRLPWKATAEFNKFMESYDLKDPFVDISIDLEKGEVYGTTEKDSTPKAFTTYGNGHQAVLMMGLNIFL